MKTITTNFNFKNKLNFSDCSLNRLKSNLNILLLVGVLFTTYNDSFGKLQKITEYFSDGKTIKSKYQIDSQNLKQGIEEEYWENGRLSSRKNLVNNKLNGLYEQYFDNGKLFLRYFAILNNIQGKYGSYEEYHNNGNIKTKYTLVNPSGYKPLRNGELLEYYYNGNIMRRENYINGIKIGKQEFFHENGKLGIVYFNNSYGKHGPYLSYFNDGKIEEKSEFNNGVLNGEREEYEQNISTNPDVNEYYLKLKEYYSNGIRVGKFETFSSVGKIVSGNYINGKKEGVWKEFTSYDMRTQKKYDYTYLERVLIYKNNKLNGEQLEYYPNGNIKSKMNYENGNIRVNEKYNENGTLNSRDSYE
jgi:antitoxin component YwqK of YwqJK toxin-antitoxin module